MRAPTSKGLIIISGDKNSNYTKKFEGERPPPIPFPAPYVNPTTLELYMIAEISLYNSSSHSGRKLGNGGVLSHIRLEWTIWVFDSLGSG